MKSHVIIIIVVLTAVLFALNLLVGSVHIPWAEVATIIAGGDTGNDAWHYIVLQSRLPGAITATLAGAALAASGLMLQTAFANPLADPSIFGISGGAALGAAVALLVMGGSVTLGVHSAMGHAAVLVSAFVGAMAVMAVILALAIVVVSPTMLLIVGIMVGYLSSSAISLLSFFSNEQGVKTYVVWGMGNFGGVGMGQMPLFAAATMVGLIVAICMAKPLNAMMLGQRYAQNLGISTHAMRTLLLLVTGMLTAITTAFCGPVAFVGLAVPHATRLIIRCDDHRILMPAVMAIGADMALMCNIMSNAPTNGIIPLNAITPLLGAPIIIYIILKADK